jgi:peptide/nickel transport system permease protein
VRRAHNSSTTDPTPLLHPDAGAEAEVALGAAEVLGGRPPRRQSRWVSVGSYVATVFVLITFNFALPRLMPGDPIDALMAFGSKNYVQNDETRAALAKYYELDASIPRQYLRYLNGLVHGDLGVSIVSNQPVRGELARRVGWSLLLLVSASGIALVVGLPLGIHSGWKRGKGVDRNLLGFFLAIQNLPVFIIGSLVFILFAFKWRLFPLGGATTAFNAYHGVGEVLDIGRHLVLPALLMAFDFVTYEYLVMRSSMVGELGSDYLLGGRAKGLSERRLKYRYAGRNALLPVVTVIGLQFSLAMSAGLIIVERIFSYPCVGGYMFLSLGTRDYPAIQGAFLLLTITVVTTNLIVDLVYRRLDPRTAT